MPLRLLVLLWLLLCIPTPAQLERAEQLLRSARPTEALTALDGITTPEVAILRFQAYWQLGLYAEAGVIMRELGEVRPPTLSVDYAVRWHLAKANFHAYRLQDRLAERYLRDGLKLALSPRQQLVLLDALLVLAVEEDDLAAAEGFLKQTELLLPRIDDELELAMHLTKVAVLADQQGRTADAMAMLTTVREIYRRHEQPGQLAAITVRIGWIFLQRGDPAGSFAQFQQCLAELGRAGYPDGTLGVVESLVGLCIRQDQQPEEGLRIITEVVSNMRPGRARDRATVHLASLQYASGQGVEARERLERLLERQDLHPIDRSSTLATLSNFQRHQGQPEKALESLRTAISVREEALGPDLPGELDRGRLWSAKGRVERELGHHSDSVASYRRAASLEESPYHEMVARRGAMVSYLSDYDLEAARKELETALARANEVEDLGLRGSSYGVLLDGLRQDRTQTYDSLLPSSSGLDSMDPLGRALLHEMISSPESLEGYLRLLDAWSARNRAAGKTVEGIYLAGMKVEFLQAVGRLPEARSLCLRVIEDADRFKVQDRRIVSRQALASIEHSAGRPTEAIEPLRQAAEIGWEVSPAEGRWRSYLLANYLREQGRYSDALEAYSRALEGAAEQAEALYGRALCYEGLARLDKAQTELRLSEAELDPKSRPLSRGVIATTRARLLRKKGEVDKALEWSRSGFDASGKEGVPSRLVAQSTEEYARNLVLHGQGEQALSLIAPVLERLLATPGQDAAPLQPLFELYVSTALGAGQHQEALRFLELSRSSDLLASIDLSRLDPEDSATSLILSELQELKERLAALEATTPSNEDARRTLTRVLASTRSEFFARLDQLKRQQPDFEALVQLSGADLSAIQSRLGSNDLLLEFYPAAEKLYVFVVGKASFRMEEVSINRSDLERRIGSYVALVRDPQSSLKAVGEASQVLHDLLLAPVLADVREGTRVRLVPAGALWNVPFEALRDSAGRSMDERYEVSYLTSADLMRTLDTAPRSYRRPLLIGAPDGEELPGATTELETLRKLLPASLKLTGERATAAALQKEAARSELLHIASHSGLGREAGEAYISLQDGAFDLAQVYSLSLPPGALVVLSSCQSALGEKVPGREVTSLATAFKIAGAATVVASHWEVDDEETTRLFTSFYRHLLEGESRAAALRKARLELAGRHPHPYYWGSFSLFGSPG